MQKLAHDPYGIHSVVLTPTRELAFQIWDQFNALGAPIRVKCEVIVGGVSMLQQSVALSARPHVVVATPGRLAAHVNSKSFCGDNTCLTFNGIGADPPYLKKTKFVVFDEADRLLESSFRKALSIINSKLPPDNQRQTLLYSATMTSTLEQLRASLSKTQKLFEFHASPIDTTVDTLDERYLLIPDQVKHAYLGYILRFWGPPDVEKSSLDIKSKSLRKKKRRRPRDVVKVEAEDPEENGVDSSANVEESNLLVDNKRAELMIIFVSTCKNCQLIGEMLLELGVNCVALHSYLTQNRRLAALGKFRSGVAKILIATDVASRGLDIPEVDLVLNYDVPRNPEDYIHRAGRTARAGRFGRAITFVTQYDVNLVLAIEKVTEKKMKLLEDVQEEEVLVLLTRMSNAKQAAKIRIDDTGQTIVKRKKGRAV